ncbi:AAA family ATPase [Acinetobacter soli]|uniref:AAA family ATPase n=1 Tax=Acinetobacter soli TaxID=487316 RepID=UPI003AA95CE7
MYINNIFIENMGAIEKLQLTSSQLIKTDKNPKTLILVGKNGTGKTTLLSSIVDSLYELSNSAFSDILPKNGNGYKYFRISGASNMRVDSSYAFAYIEYKNKDNHNYEYIEKNGQISSSSLKEKTQNLLRINISDKNGNFKEITNTKESSEFKKDFSSNSYCYFPSDRYELPYWLNRETIKQSEQFVDIKRFNDQLDREILVRRSIDDIKQWILDVFLDSRADLVFEGPNVSTKISTSTLRLLKQSIENIENIISKIVQTDISIDLNFRGHGHSRIKLVEKGSRKIFSPTLDNLSAGQSTLLGIFATIIKYSDRLEINKSINLNEIEGIVIIDEVDLHLHIELQYQVLPQLIQLFPKVQFIITTHSPFLLAGISDKFTLDDYVMVNMPDGVLIERADDFEEFTKAYSLFQDITNAHKEELNILKQKILSSTKPLIITEGKTDWKHLVAAFKQLGHEYAELDIEFLKYEDELKMGSSALKTMLENLKKVPQSRKIIGIFDRDEPAILKEYGENFYNDLGNNVYVLCIPKISEALDQISIEYYYPASDLKKEDKHGRRLFDGLEFHKSGNSMCGNFQAQEKSKTGKQIIIDSGVFKSDDLEWQNSVALSKNNFAEYILNKEAEFSDIQFSNFSKIFDIIKAISIC